MVFKEVRCLTLLRQITGDPNKEVFIVHRRPLTLKQIRISTLSCKRQFFIKIESYSESSGAKFKGKVWTQTTGIHFYTSNIILGGMNLIHL